MPITLLTIHGSPLSVNISWKNKFKEFQEELTGKMYCQVLKLNCHGAILEYEVSEDLLVGESIRKVKFKVCLIQEDGEECEIKCVCRLFEFRGILCQYALATLSLEGIHSNIPNKYLFLGDGGKS